jgi:hypothetical protein
MKRADLSGRSHCIHPNIPTSTSSRSSESQDGRGVVLRVPDAVEIHPLVGPVEPASGDAEVDRDDVRRVGPG